MFKNAGAPINRYCQHDNNNNASRWQQIARSIFAAATRKWPDAPRFREAPDDGCFRVFIRVLERPTDRTAHLLWRDPGQCYYADQLWLRGVAAYLSRCALSGLAVTRGDYIYRPRQGKVRTLNAFAIIRASALETSDFTKN